MVTRRFAKPICAGSIPAHASSGNAYAWVVELVYTQHLKCCPLGDVGSIPTPGTNNCDILLTDN